MAKALTPHDIPGWTAERSKRKAAKGREDSRKDFLKGKTFEDLTEAEKGRLLKAVAVHLGLIVDSDDS